MAVSLSSPSSSTITPVTLNQKMKNDSWVYGTIFLSGVTWWQCRPLPALQHVMDASGVSLVLIGPGSMDQDKEARDDPPIEEILKACCSSRTSVFCCYPNTSFLINLF
ncbi:hypothetical protein YC2023_047291 [Brassica napus]